MRLREDYCEKWVLLSYYFLKRGKTVEISIICTAEQLCCSISKIRKLMGKGYANDETWCFQQKHLTIKLQSNKTLLTGDMPRVHLALFKDIDNDKVKRAAIRTKDRAGPSSSDMDG